MAADWVREGGDRIYNLLSDDIYWDREHHHTSVDILLDVSQYFLTISVRHSRRTQVDIQMSSSSSKNYTESDAAKCIL